MIETLTYTAVIDGVEVEVKRHPPSNGLGLSMSPKAFTSAKPITRKKKAKPVDEQLHTLDMLLVDAMNAEDSIATIRAIQESIDARIKELTNC